ncbi:MAG: hypothetical protein M1814_000924 [Vezdaea aestivalis]|nr:MAG: hypothetical protein M1814_000924 [Vezdaea aestivalis]
MSLTDDKEQARNMVLFLGVFLDITQNQNVVEYNLGQHKIKSRELESLVNGAYCNNINKIDAAGLSAAELKKSFRDLFQWLGKPDSPVPEILVKPPGYFYTKMFKSICGFMGITLSAKLDDDTRINQVLMHAEIWQGQEYSRQTVPERLDRLDLARNFLEPEIKEDDKPLLDGLLVVSAGSRFSLLLVEFSDNLKKALSTTPTVPLDGDGSLPAKSRVRIEVASDHTTWAHSLLRFHANNYHAPET